MSAQPNHMSSIRLPVRDQGRRPTCVAFASAALHEMIVGSIEYHSPEFVFWLAKRTDRLPAADGTTIEAALDGIVNEGGLYEAGWPYGQPAFPPGPAPSVASTGPFVPAGFQYRKLVGGFSAISAAVVGGPVLLALAVQGQGVWSATRGILVSSATAPIAGAHAVPVVGVDRSLDALVFKNSWGTRWGDAGYGYATRGYIDTHLLAAYQAT